MRAWPPIAILIIAVAASGLGVSATRYTACWAPFVTCVVLMGFFNDLIMGSAWATCQDVGRRYAAIVAGTMNMVGNLGAALGNFITGSVLKYWRQQGDPERGITTMFTVYAIIYGVGVLLWLKIDASKPIVEDEPAAEGTTVE